MLTLSWIIIATIIISLISFIGVLTLGLKEKLLNKILLVLVALSAGALIGGAFLHLIPEALEENSHTSTVFIYVLVGFGLFYLVEKSLHWRHCHKGHCEIHTFAHMSLIGDAVHNFIDGLIIASSFVMDPKLGIVTTIAVALHEIPQEIGDFGVLIYGGFKKSKALFLNFLTATTALFGGIFGYFLSTYVESATELLTPLAAGGFIYIAASDLIPELHKESKFYKSLIAFACFFVGVGLMFLLKILPK